MVTLYLLFSMGKVAHKVSQKYKNTTTIKGLGHGIGPGYE